MNSPLFRNHRNVICILAIAVVNILMHWSIFQRDLIGIHLWRQSQTQLNISNFYRVDNNILHPRVNVLDSSGEPQIIRTDFPLAQWTVAQVYRIFGESITVTRVSMFFLGILSIVGFFLVTLTLLNNFWVAAITAWALSFSPVFYYYTLNPLPDNLALCFAIWSIYFFIKYRKGNQLLYAFISAACLGLAALVKLPYILFGAIYAHAFFSSFFISSSSYHNSIGKKFSFALLYVIFILPAAMWYFTVIPDWGGNPVLKGNFSYEGQLNRVAEILEYHITTMFPQLLMNYAGLVLLFLGIAGIIINGYYKKQLFWQIGSGFLFVVFYFIYEFFPIDIIHDYYLMPFLPFLYLLIASGILFILRFKRFTVYPITLAAVLMPVLTYMKVQDNWTVERSYINDNIIVYQEEFKKAIPSDALCIFMNDVSLHVWPYLLDKKGYVFSGDHLPTGWIEDMIRNKNVRYMYSDSRAIDENLEYQYLFDSLLLQKGTLKLIKLKMASKLPVAN